MKLKAYFCSFRRINVLQLTPFLMLVFALMNVGLEANAQIRQTEVDLDTQLISGSLIGSVLRVSRSVSLQNGQSIVFQNGRALTELEPLDLTKPFCSLTVQGQSELHLLPSLLYLSQTQLSYSQDYGIHTWINNEDSTDLRRFIFICSRGVSLQRQRLRRDQSITPRMLWNLLADVLDPNQHTFAKGMGSLSYRDLKSVLGAESQLSMYDLVY